MQTEQTKQAGRTDSRVCMLAVSRAGHDKGKLYVVADLDQKDVWLVNGETRKLDRPKRKKRMHVQLVKHMPGEVHAALMAADSDEAIKNVINRYQDLQMEENACRKLT